MTTTPAHLYELGVSMAEEGASLYAILRVLLDEGATDLELVQITKRIQRVSFKRARELIDASGLVPASPKQVTIIVPEDDPWYVEMFTIKSSNENARESDLSPEPIELRLPCRRRRRHGSPCHTGPRSCPPARSRAG
jgi:hypothetical protein